MDHLTAAAGTGGRSRPTEPGVIAIALDYSGVLIPSVGFDMARAVYSAALDAVRNELGDRASVSSGPLDQILFLLFDVAVVAVEDIVAATIHHLGRPVRVDGRDFFVQSRVGLATADGICEAEPSVLIEAALGAVHIAIKTGVHFHEADSALLSELRREVELRTALAKAVDTDFEMHYQPIVSLDSKEVLGYESLLRWRSGGRLLAPAEFLEAAEETSLIIPIGKAGTSAALKQLDRWNEGTPSKSFFVAVNFSARQLSDPVLLPHIERLLAKFELDPSAIWVEITEQDLIKLASPAVRTIESLAELGCTICVDDLGTGFAALRYLADLPISVVKIDRSLISSLMDQTSLRSIVEAICDISHALGIETVAEGVEREDQLPLLRDLGFTHAQGYYFGRPAAASDIVLA
ncbi:EAL domain-containing protein [Dietzia alimentaria]|uniref:EAL domain-containing protein n=1 Tax=Dietzia alimentaria TaxID=665550 RepID=UPI00029ADE6E|nr:EAL domain-containing protein [Dietzia alimentaria]